MDADAWNTRYAGSELVWSAGPNQWVESELAGLPPGRALDLACGEGRNALWLAGLGWRVTASDFAEQGLAKGRAAQDRLEAGGTPMALEWVCADATAVTWPPDAFDLVVVAYLQLVPPLRREATRRAAAALAPGGTLLVVGHDSSNLEHGWGGPQDPAVLFTAADVVDDLAGLGLEVVRADRVERRVETEDGPRVALDALARLTRPA
ncbi:class I SAM-dependent methyltransferase [Oryzihumus sp.]|uniref:class I SAM-dependent methyltransferase n=1 Tax=Oryzihumus sp. TaxID=1968903 RepID=UPI002ED9567A